MTATELACEIPAAIVLGIGFIAGFRADRRRNKNREQFGDKKSSPPDTQLVDFTAGFLTDEALHDLDHWFHG